MKKILIFLIALIVLSEVKGQVVVPPGYSGRNSRENILAIAANAVNITAGDSAQYKIGQWRRAGLVYVDTTGADSGYYYSGSGQRIRRLLELKDTALFSGGGGSSDTANILIQTGGENNVRTWWDNFDTLMLKGQIGLNFINITTRSDSTLQVALDTGLTAYKDYIKQNSAAGSGQGFTPGASLFVGTDGNADESPTVYFWDQTNSRLGLGTNAPSVRLHVSQNVSTLAAFTSTVGSAPETGGFIAVGNNDGSTLDLGDRMGGYLWRAMLSSSTFSNSASIEAYAEGAHTASSTPTKLKFMASPSGSLVRDTLVEFSSTGLVTFEKYTTAGSFTSADTTTYKPLGIDATGKIERMVYWPVGSGGSGETNTASNLGGGLANFSAKVGVDLQFNSFLASHFNLVGNVIESDTATLWPLLRATIPAGGGASDHGALTGLTDDDHTQYPLLIGRSGGQTLKGGTGTTDDLKFVATSGAGGSGANIYFQVGTDGAVTPMIIFGDGSVGVGTIGNTAKFEVSHTANTTARFSNTATSSTSQGATINLIQNDGGNTDATHRIGAVFFSGTIGSTPTSGAGLFAYSQGYSTGSSPTDLAIETAPTGSTTRAEVARFTSTARVGIGTTVPDARFDINLGTAEVFQLSYNDANGSAANKMTVALSSIGSPTFDATGTSPQFIFSDNIAMAPNKLTAGDLSLVNLDVDAAPDSMLTIEGGVVNKTLIPTISGYTSVDSLMSGQYTPTLANVANVAGTTAVLVNYQKVGSIVHVQGVGSCTVTASGGTLTTMSITLPFASAMTLVTDCSGSGTARTSAAALPAYVATNTTTDVAEVSFYSGSGSHDVHFSFTYKVK